MSANKIAETSTSTGTGDFTLTGAWSVPSSFITGNRTFNSFYGLNHRFPYMIQDQGGNWEKGVGYLSDAATLVRETVIDNSLSTTALIDFPAGVKLVMVPTDAGILWPETLDAGSYITSISSLGFSGASYSLPANQLMLSPFICARPMAVSALTFEVLTAASGGNVKPLIYKPRNFSPSSMTVDLIAVGDPISVGTTGRKSAPIAANLGQGSLYLIGIVSDSNPAVRTTGIAAAMSLGLGNGLSSGNNSGFYASVTNSYSTPPVIRSGAFYIEGNGLRVGLEGRFL